MNTEEIIQVIENEALPDTCNNADYVETPNSWIIRSDNYAFKIRKPVQANGKDLSTTEQRKNVCLKELKLNKTLAGKTYEDVFPLKKVGSEKQEPGETRFIVVDYALKMKRLPDNKNLFESLKQRDISKEEIKEIASTIAKFHKKADTVKNTFNITGFQKEFEEIKRCEDFMLDAFGETYIEAIYKSIEASKEFLNDNRYFELLNL